MMGSVLGAPRRHRDPVPYRMYRDGRPGTSSACGQLPGLSMGGRGPASTGLLPPCRTRRATRRQERLPPGAGRRRTALCESSWSERAVWARRSPGSRPAVRSSSTWSSSTTTSAGRRRRSGPSARRAGRFTAARLDASDPTGLQAALAEHRCDVLLNATDPRFVHAAVRRRPRPRRPLCRHGDVAVPAASLPPVRGVRRQAGRRAVRAGRRMEGGGSAGARRHGCRAGSLGCLRPLRLRRTLRRDRRDRHQGRRQPGRRRIRLRAVVQYLDDHRGMPEPPGRLRGGEGLVHHGAVQRAGGLRLPRGHRPGGVRQCGARGSTAGAAVAEDRGGSPSSTVSATSSSAVLRTLHKLGLDRTDPVTVPSAGGQGRGLPARCRRRLSARPGRSRRPDARQDLCGHLGQGHQGRAAAGGLPLPRGRQPVVDAGVRLAGRGLADRDQPRGRSRTRRVRRLAGQRGARPRGAARPAVPRPADGVRIALGHARGHSRGLRGPGVRRFPAADPRVSGSAHRGHRPVPRT